VYIQAVSKVRCYRRAPMTTVAVVSNKRRGLTELFKRCPSTETVSNEESSE
jgi:hypothetical protein